MSVRKRSKGWMRRGDVEDDEFGGGREAREEVRHQEAKAGTAPSDEDNFGGGRRIEGPWRAGGFEGAVVTERQSIQACIEPAQKTIGEQCLQDRKECSPHYRWYALDQTCAKCFWPV